MTTSPRPMPRPDAAVGVDTGIEAAVALANADPQTLAASASAAEQPVTLAAQIVHPPKRNAPIYTDENAKLALVTTKPEVVTRVSTSSGGQTWGVNLGAYPTTIAAEKALLQVQLAETATLGNGLRKVVARSNGYDAVVMGLDRDTADLACRKLQARAVQCFTIGE
jgi:D-alanyl-D-alanine carboxypeptidase